ncbi:MAG: hypothetical protein K6U87_10755 [Firmicutes bacterium]|nr:hypothetical protein [Bacillota bacterium]
MEAHLPRLPARLAAVIRQLPAPDRPRWVMRFRDGLVASAARLVAEWLLEPEKLAWWVISGLEWDRGEGEAGLLLAYPEPLGADPVAMGYLGWVAAGSDAGRRRRVAERLGPVFGLSLYCAGAASPEVRPWLGSWVSSYREACEAHGLDAVAEWAWRWAGEERLEREVAWPTVPPQAQEYRQHLLMGLAPHDPGGLSPADPVAVLWALSTVEEAQRPAAAALCTKALEGRRLSLLWGGLAGLEASASGEGS